MSQKEKILQSHSWLIGMETVEMNNENGKRCENEDCDNPDEGHCCGNYGSGFCGQCHESYHNGEWELDYNHPNEGRDDA